MRRPRRETTRLPPPAATERARLFVALELPAAVRWRLSRWADEQLSGLPGVRPVAAPSLHVTLCFLGSRPAMEVGEIAAACRAVAMLPVVPLQLGAAMWLPRRRPRVVAVELSDDRGRLAAVQSALAAALSEGGFYEPEDRPFLGHVTVGRVGRTADRHQGGAQPSPAPEAQRFDARSVTLYRSRLGSGPARYEALATVTLTGG